MSAGSGGRRGSRRVGSRVAPVGVASTQAVMHCLRTDNDDVKLYKSSMPPPGADTPTGHIYDYVFPFGVPREIVAHFTLKYICAPNTQRRLIVQPGCTAPRADAHSVHTSSRAFSQNASYL